MTEEPGFKSAEELFEALGNPNAIERRSVLAWVAAHPAEAIAMGGMGGRDVVDVLIGLTDESLEYGYWQDAAMAIGAFDSPKVTDFFCEMLATATEAVAAMDATNALARRDLSGHRERLLELLFSDDAPDRAVGAAELLSGDPGLPERAAVRVSLLEAERTPPPLTPSATDGWVDELCGPFASQARDRLEKQGPDAARALAQRWERLGEEDRGWLLGWTTEAVPTEAGAMVTLVLQGSDDLAQVALACAARLPAGTVHPALLERWVENPDPSLRAAAIAAGADVDAESLLAAGDEPEVMVAAIERLAGEAGAGAAATIAAQLGPDSAEVRAAARGALVGIGPEAVEHLRPLVHSPSPEIRAAAVSALLDLGDDDWLAGELLDQKAG